MKIFKKVLVWGISAIAFCVAGLYLAIVYVTLDEDPLTLVSCIDANPGWRAWTCKQVLRYVSLTPEHVRELNSVAGVVYAVLMDDPKEAEEALELFLARGVDINAVSQQAKGWTALHIILGDPSQKVALLLKHGARTDIRDEDGRTPLELARHAMQRRPADPYLMETIRILEEAERK